MALWRRVVLVFLLLLGGVVGLFSWSGLVPVSWANQDDLLVARGKYLADTICIECHTVRVPGDPYTLDNSRLYAGGERFELPFGNVYSSNLTLDRATGLGTWTAAEIKTATRDGISKDGRKLVLMPWENFRGLATADLDAIVAYLQSLPPISNRVPEAELRAPREALHAEAARNARPEGPGTAPTGINSPARGEYLVRNLLGCQGCHGPDLAGGIPPFFAPNSTPDKDTGIGLWSNEDIVRAVREGVNPRGQRMNPVMPASTSYRNLSDDDTYNVIAYLRSIPPVFKERVRPPAAPVAAPPPARPAELPRAGDADLLPWMGVMALLALGAIAGGLALRRWGR